MWQCVCSGEVVERENSFVEVSDTHFPSLALPVTVSDRASCCMHELSCGKERSG